MNFDRRGGSRRAKRSRVSPRWLPFEGDGGRLYFGLISTEKKKRNYLEQTADSAHFHVLIFPSFFSVELVPGLWNDGVCRESELARR